VLHSSFYSQVALSTLDPIVQASQGCLETLLEYQAVVGQTFYPVPLVLAEAALLGAVLVEGTQVNPTVLHLWMPLLLHKKAKHLHQNAQLQHQTAERPQEKAYNRHQNAQRLY